MGEVKALYIHIPFCISKCKYCDFFSIPCGCKDCAIPYEYITALCNEIIYRLKSYNVSVLETIYIGGGTPSLLHKKQLELIFSAIRNNVDINNNCEITIEANPDDITEGLLKDWKSMGINRISLGIQSFCDSALSYVSRRATAAINIKALNIIKKVWHDDLSVDLICGLPKQNPDSFENDLNTLIGYKPDHISMYSLTIEDGTPLGREVCNGSLEYDYDFADNLWLGSKNRLEEAGYIHYEVSNFCIPGKECRHNLKYWNHECYIGCGSGGTGSFYYDDGSGIRWTNLPEINKYCTFWNKNIVSGEDICLPEERENISVDTSIFEFFMMGMRKLSGINEYNFTKIFNMPIPGEIIKSLQKWNKKGLCEITDSNDGKCYTLGHKGILYLNRFLEEII